MVCQYLTIPSSQHCHGPFSYAAHGREENSTSKYLIPSLPLGMALSCSTSCYPLYGDMPNSSVFLFTISLQPGPKDGPEGQKSQHKVPEHLARSRNFTGLHKGLQHQPLHKGFRVHCLCPPPFQADLDVLQTARQSQV